jgi:hypothetical protein
MNILDRFHLARLERELDTLQAEDKAARAGATTMDMMQSITLRTALIVKIQNKIAALYGDVPEEPESRWGPELPTGIGANEEITR